MKLPEISVVIATYNSQRTLKLVLESIKKQDYPKDKIEILIVDGGSTDGTTDIAKKFKCRLFKNEKVDQVYGKFLGYQKSIGRYLLFLDSDEVLECNLSIRNKLAALKETKNAYVALSSGYKKPKNSPSINNYINEFGDPFSYFMYHDTKSYKYFLKNISQKYQSIYSDPQKAIFNFSKYKELPFIELTSMGALIDKKYVKKYLPIVFERPAEHTHLFYLLNNQKSLFVIMKDDVVIHYSAANLQNYLKKIKSRIKSNIFGTQMGEAGYKGRQKYVAKNYQRFGFVIYTLSIILPLWDSISLSISRKSTIYIIHILLCFYTLTLIIYFYILKLLQVKVKLYGYGT